ncbi:STAS domain-containing protein [Streptomyces subrutilus]|uniref:STAS domain-containing protein n=1 Tax=Streptomyces subrutilus TaxID=36818 RepID=UPI003405C210
MFSVQVTYRAEGTVFALRGELDHDSVVQVHEAGERELVQGGNAGPVVIDCAALSFCDSSGIAAMVRLYQQLALRQRSLRLAAVPVAVARLFSVTGLDQVFAVCADVEQALGMDADRRDIVSAGSEGPAQAKGRQNT